MTKQLHRKFRWLALCAILAAPVAASASSALALPGFPIARDRKAFEEIDVDKDGRVSEEEFVKHELRRRFEAADVNKDGRLSKDEYLASIKNEAGKRQADLDWKLINGGKDFVTLEEFTQNDGAAKQVSAEFKKLDRNKDGFVTLNEWTKGKRAAKRAGAGALSAG